MFPKPTKVEAPLGTDTNGSEAKRDWTNSYDYVIWMMFYLSVNTIPYISFDINQCARFTHNTKSSHKMSLKRICPYLQGIKESGLVFNPSKKLVVDFYADVDFSGLWGHENPQDSICAISIWICGNFCQFTSVVGVKITSIYCSFYTTFWVCGIVSFCSSITYLENYYQGSNLQLGNW